MRRRIVALVAGMITLVVFAFAVPLALLIRHNVYNDATRSLQDEANSVANFLHGYVAPTPAQITAHIKTLPNTVSVELTSGQVLGTPPPGGVNAAPPPLDPDPGFDGEGRGGPPQPTTKPYHDGRIAQLVVFDPLHR